MKSIKIFISFLLIANFSFSQSFRNIELQATGLTCSMCSNAINKALKQIYFVQEVQTDLKKSIFTISIKDGEVPDFDMIRKKVEDAGFAIGKMTVDINFTTQKITNDEHTVIANKAFHFLNVKDQTLNGWQKVQLVDKGFLVSGQEKKWQKATVMPCYKTGTAESCCTKSNIKAGQRIYHITI